MEILALVPARGGSKGIPRKNIRLLAGEPLIAYTIKAAQRSRYITRLIVSTDDEEIAGLGREYGAEVPFLRPQELAQDHVTDLPVFCHCLSWLQQHQGYHPDVTVHLRPTAPLRTAAHIDSAIELLLNSTDAESVRSVCRAAQHPLKMWALKGDYLSPFVSAPQGSIKEAYNMPRQKLPPAYIQNGAVDVVRTEVILKKGSMTGDVIKALLMDEEESLNIDGPLDWELADLLMKRRKRIMDNS
jgi:CMP-N-acetylneuraminic acid synthetase